jgi:hypothetical protein
MVFQILTELRGDFGIAHTSHYFVIHVIPVNHAVLAMNDQLSLTTPMLLHNKCSGCMHAAILAESSCSKINANQNIMQVHVHGGGHHNAESDHTQLSASLCRRDPELLHGSPSGQR